MDEEGLKTFIFNEQSAVQKVHEQMSYNALY